MLCRVAETIYWMHRYRERAEDLARLIEVSFMLNIDLPDGEKQWEPLLQGTSELEIYREYYPKINKENIIDFLTFDLRNPSSILSSLSFARENARSVREIINSEMWHELNTLYLFISQNRNALENPYNFYTRVKRQCQLFTGISDSTMTHGKAWHFGRTAYLLERADMVSRSLDVKYFMLLPSPEHVGSPFDNIQWNALLRSNNALEMYRQKWQQVKHTNVVDFLMVDKNFPRSIYNCLVRATDSLIFIKNHTENPKAGKPCRIAKALLKKLEAFDGTRVIEYGLHEFVDEIQCEINKIHESISAVYFD